jgi:hypothetical protein
LATSDEDASDIGAVKLATPKSMTATAHKGIPTKIVTITILLLVNLLVHAD